MTWLGRSVGESACTEQIRACRAVIAFRSVGDRFRGRAGGGGIRNSRGKKLCIVNDNEHPHLHITRKQTIYESLLCKCIETYGSAFPSSTRNSIDWNLKPYSLLGSRASS